MTYSINNKSLFTIALLYISFCGYAQQWKPVYNSQWCYLHKTADSSSEQLGILSIQASLMVLDSVQDFYKVQVNNGDIGYIYKQELKSSKMGVTESNEPEQYFYRGEQGTQGPHRFVNVSRLRSRAQSNAQSSIVQVLPINKMIAIDYIPFYKDGWVYIGDHFHEKPEYIQYKYLGEQLTFDKVLDDYRKAANASVREQQNIVERLVEMGWKDKPENTLKALQMQRDFHFENGTMAEIPNIDFDLFLAEQQLNPMSWEEKEAFIHKSDIHFVVKGQKLYDGKITEQQTILTGAVKNTYISETLGCDFLPDFLYFSKDLLIAFAEYETGDINGTVHKMNFNEDQALVVGNHIIDNQYGEKDFVRNFGKIVNVNCTETPHSYTIQNGDTGLFIITFKNGFAFKYEMIYFC